MRQAKPALRLLRFAAAWIFVLLCACPAWAGPVEDYDLAYKHYQAKHFDVAAEGFSEFIKNNPAHERRPLADLYYGQSLMQLRKFPEARTVFGDFLKANPDHPDFALAMYREAECTFFLNDAMGAAPLFSAFLQKYPDNDLSAWAWYYLGESQLRLKNADKAAEAFQSGLDKFPTSQRATESRFALARAYQALKDYDKASAAFRAISDDAANPRAADALFYLGSMEFDAQRYAEAAAAFTSLREKFPDYRQASAAALNAGSAYYKLGQFDQAVAAFNAAAASPKDKLMARFWAGQARRSQNKLEEAIEINRTAYNEVKDDPNLKDDPNAAKLLYYWGDCEFRRRNYAAAIPLFEQFVATYPTHDFADDSLHYALDAALKAGDLDQAERLHQRFVKEFPRSGLKMLEAIRHGEVLLAKAELLSAKPPLSAEAKAYVISAAETFEDVANASKIPRTSAWATLLLARSRSRLGDSAGVIAAATPLNERLNALDNPEEFAESLYLTGIAAGELQQWILADASFERYLKFTKDPGNVAAALAQLVLARSKAGKIEQLEELWPRFEAAGVAPLAMAQAIEAAADLASDQLDFAAAATLYERVEATPEASPLHAQARSGLGHARFNEGKFVPAAEAFGRLIDDPPATYPKLVSDAAFMKGRALEMAGRAEEAANAYLNGALLIAGSNGRVGDPPASEEAAFDAYRCIERAAAMFEALKDIDKSDDAYAQAWEYLGKLPPERKADLDKLVYNWARANYVAKKYKRADEIYQRLLNDHPRSSFADDAEFYLTESTLLSGNTAEAESALKRLLDAPGTDDAIRQKVLRNLIELMAERQDWSSVKTYAGQLLDRFPISEHRTDARYRLGEAALKTKEIATARQVFADLRKSIASGEAGMNPEVAEGVWILSAEAEMAAADYTAVDKLAEEFHSRFPQSKLTYQVDYVHGRSLIRRAPPDVDKARTVFQAVVDSPDGKLTETAAQADLAIAGTYLLAKKAEELPVAYVRYYNIVERYNDPPIQSAALLKAGEIQELMKNADRAVSAYQELLARFPMSHEVEQAKARLKALKTDSTPAPDLLPKPTEPPPAAPSPAEPKPTPATENP